MYERTATEELAALTIEEVLGDQAERCEGIFGWWQVPRLGGPNLARLLDIGRSEATRRLHLGEDAAEMRRLRRGLDYLEDCESAESKPLLPRLRTECFKLGDEVVAFLGDTPDAQASGWVPGRITAIEKSHKLEWVCEAPTSGYYWRVTMTADREVLQGSRSLAFSTSEPRVLKAWELDWLRRSRDELFLCSFSINATREWSPIWRIERGGGAACPAPRYRDWLVRE